MHRGIVIMRLLTLETATHALPVVEFVDEVSSAYPRYVSAKVMLFL